MRTGHSDDLKAWTTTWGTVREGCKVKAVPFPVDISREMADRLARETGLDHTMG